MITEAWVVIAILVVAVLLFATEKLPMDVVALSVLALLVVIGLVNVQEALSGFSSPATITVAAMFVLSAGIQRSGLLAALGRLLARVRIPWLFTLLVMLVIGFVSAFVNNTAAVAVFLPLVLAAAAANKAPASRVLIPMSYAAQMGGACTLIGTSTNLLVNSVAHDMGQPGFTLFEFAQLGMVMAGFGFVYVMAVGRYLLPDRHAVDPSEDYSLGKYVTELVVTEDSRLVGKSVAEAKLADQYGVYVLELLRRGQKIWSPRAQLLEPGDVLLVRGEWAQLSELKDRARLQVEPEFAREAAPEETAESDQILVEAMIAPGSRLAGHTLASLDFHWQYGATVLAIHRRGHVVRRQLKRVPLDVGDILMMRVPESALPQLRRNPALVVLSEKEAPQLSSRRAVLSLAILAAVVGTAALGWLPIVASAIAGCAALLLTRCLDPEDAYEAIDWRVILLLAGLLPLGIALSKSGAAAALAQAALELFGNQPVLALAVLYLVTALLTEAMSNNAAAVLLAPIAISTALGLGVDPKPFLIAVMFAASTSFATPVGYQTNTMVYSAGGYRFGDFVR
ncbi:MAG TPA: SLC13 family permease, partial [Xanthomonadaceae bacterium]|nr:SLC13 family permease [Xanthomonadaceae bacterium]